MKLKLKQYYRENRMFIWGVFFIYIFQIQYLLNATSNIPLMDYWTYINQFTDKVFMGNLTVSDYWGNFTSHRAPFQYLLFFLNLKLFSGNTLTCIYLGSIVTLVTAFILYHFYSNTMSSQPAALRQMGMLLITLMLFNLNRWEIVMLEFSAAFSVRIMLYILLFGVMDRFCMKKIDRDGYVWEMGMAVFITILVFSSSYFPAMVAAIAIAMLITLSRASKAEKPKFLKYCIIIGGFAITATIIYLYDFSSGSVPVHIISLDFWINLGKAILTMLASSILHENHINQITPSGLLMIGFIILLIYVGSVWLYVREKIYRITLMPVMLIIYSFVSIIMIYYARAALFGTGYLVASRYTYETSLGLIGVIWIYIFIFSKMRSDTGESAEIKSRLIRVFALGVCCVLTGCVLYTDKTEREMAVYRKAYMQNLQEIALNIDEYDDDELSGFQANQPEYVRNGVELMKKYKLGIFKYQ